jgi:hypothetical protein
MLSVKECVKKMKDWRKVEIQALTVQAFCDEVLSNAQIGKLDGIINVQFRDQEFNLALEAIEELIENDFDFKRYVTIDNRFLDDKEITLEFNLERSFKIVDNELKVCNNEYAEDDIPF